MSDAYYCAIEDAEEGLPMWDEHELVGLDFDDMRDPTRPVVLPNHLPQESLPKMDVSHLLKPPSLHQGAGTGSNIMSQDDEGIPPRRRDPKNKVIQTKWKH